MTELIDKQLIAPNPQLGSLMDDPAWANRYLEGSVIALSDPAPVPGQHSAEALSEYYIDSLISAGPQGREGAIYALFDTYLAAADLPISEGPMDESIAGRNLVTGIVYSAQQWAFENNNTELSSQMVWLACNLINEEIGRGSLGAASNMLQGVIHNALSRQSQADNQDSGYESDSGLAESWYSLEDAGSIHKLLSRLVLANKFDYRQNASIDFMLSNWNLDPDMMRYAWSQGFTSDSRPEEFQPSQALRSNLHRIATIEEQYPGISQRLNQNNRIKSFARLSPKFLAYLDHELPNDRTASGIFVATADEYDAFNTPAQFDDLLDQATAIGHFLEYYEFGSIPELKWVQTQFRNLYPDIRSVLISSHSTGYNLIADYSLPTSEGEYTVEDMKTDKEHLQFVFGGIGRAALWGCRSDVEGGLSEILRWIVRGLTVEGLSRIMGVRAIYTERGFEMIKDNERIPAPAPNVPVPGILERVTNPPRVRARKRLSDREELLNIVLNNMLARGRFYVYPLSDEDG